MIDTTGTVTNKELKSFYDEIQEILKESPEKVIIIPIEDVNLTDYKGLPEFNIMRKT